MVLVVVIDEVDAFIVPNSGIGALFADRIRQNAVDEGKQARVEERETPADLVEIV